MMNERFNKLFLAFIFSIGSIAIGIIGFSQIEGMDFVNAIYMTVITISTVGFTEVTDLSPNGRLFTSVYIIFNMAIFAYILTVVSSYFLEGKLQEALRTYRSNMKLNKLKDHVIVCGFGRNGKRACLELQQSKKEFIIIEKEESKTQSIPKDMKWFIGDATKDEDLQFVGIERASAIIITPPSDSINVFVTLTARNLNSDIKVITRTSSFETQDKLYHAGADHVIMPDLLGGMFMAHLITKPIVIEFLNLINGVSGLDYHLEDIDYEELKEEYKDQSLETLDIMNKTGVIVLGVKDDVKGIIPAPSPTTLIGKEDHLILLGSASSLEEFAKEFTKR